MYEVKKTHTHIQIWEIKKKKIHSLRENMIHLIYTTHKHEKIEILQRRKMIFLFFFSKFQLHYKTFFYL